MSFSFDKTCLHVQGLWFISCEYTLSFTFLSDVYFALNKKVVKLDGEQVLALRA